MSPAAGTDVSRRGFLRLLGAGASLGALARLPLAASAGCAPGAPGDGRFFDARETELLTLVVERMVDTGQPGAPAVTETAAIATIDRLCAGLAPELTAPLPMLLRLVDWAPVLFEWRLTRFSRMAPEERDASLRGWMTSRLELRRRAFYALRNLAFLGWWSQPESWPLVGYAGPLLGPGEVAG